MDDAPDPVKAIRRDAAPQIILQMAMSAVLAELAIAGVDEDTAVNRIVEAERPESVPHSPAERAVELVRRGQSAFKCFYLDDSATVALQQLAVLVVEEVPDAMLDQWFEAHETTDLSASW